MTQRAGSVGSLLIGGANLEDLAGAQWLGLGVTSTMFDAPVYHLVSGQWRLRPRATDDFESGAKKYDSALWIPSIHIAV